MNREFADPFAAKLRGAFEHSVSAKGITFISFVNPRAPSLLMTRNAGHLPQVVPVLLAGTLLGGEEANTTLGLELSTAGDGWLPLFQGMTDGDGFYGIMAPFLFYRAPDRGTFRSAAQAVCEELGERGLLTSWCFVRCGIQYLTKDGRFHSVGEYEDVMRANGEPLAPQNQS